MTGDIPAGRSLSPVAPAIVVMGVSASGKSTIASELARILEVPWIDGDDLHPPANVAKMASGTPLDDDDRAPWLAAVGRGLALGAASAGVVIACSALKVRYRDQLRSACPGVVFIHLSGSKELLTHRATSRRNHFMPADMLESQLATLEPLTPEESGVVLDIAAAPRELADQAEKWVRAHV